MKTLGHIPDHDHVVEEDLRYRHVGQLLGAAPIALPAEMDYSSLLRKVPDQLQTSSCVGQSFATSIEVRARISGHPIERPSAKAIYDVARLLDQPHGRLVDAGSRPRAALTGLQEYGIVAESRWPLSEEAINQSPPLDVFGHGAGALLSGYYRIAADNKASALLRQAVARGFCPFFAMPVDQAYESYDGSALYCDLTGPSLGGHAQCIVGYGIGYFVVANSWGSSWGDRGFARIASEFFDSGKVSDLLVPTIVPEKVS